MTNTPSPAVRYLPVTPTSEQREIGRASDLYQHGDMILAWVNEGDLGEVNLISLPTDAPESAIQHRGILLGARACAAAIRALSQQGDTR